MLFRANFSREYMVEIEAETQEEAENIASNMTDTEIGLNNYSDDGIVFWDIEESENA